MPTNGKKYLLVITDDFSLTTVLHNTATNDASAVVTALLDDWLSIYPDPDLLHTDGGSHFSNAVIKGLTEARGWEHTICTPYAKWASGVAERNNRMVIDILTPLCQELKVPVNKWPKIIKMVQSAMNRRLRPSRGNMSPIQLTTGITPRTVASMIRTDGGTVDVLDQAAAVALDVAAQRLAERMEEIYDTANAKRRATSEKNRRNTDDRAVPDVNVGDFVLYAEHKKHTKLDYTWLGPAVVTAQVTPLVFTIRPYTLYESQERDIHITRLRRFAGSQLHVTEQLRLAIEHDHPDNIVAKIVGHQEVDGVLWMMCRWRGFTAELDSLQEATVLCEDCPDRVKEYYKDVAHDTALDNFMHTAFPSLEHEEAIERQRRQAGAVATGRRSVPRQRGRTLQQIRNVTTTQPTTNAPVPRVRRRAVRTATITPAMREELRQRAVQKANGARAERRRRRSAASGPATSNDNDSQSETTERVEATEDCLGGGVMTIIGDLLEADDSVIVHQTNCTTTTAAGLARTLFQRFPHANTYTARKHVRSPATIDVRGRPGQERVVVNFNAQIRPGKAAASGEDSEEARMDMFQRCLAALAVYIRESMEDPVTVGFPWRIGCGLAGGTWQRYHHMIKEWARGTTTSTGRDVAVRIYRLPAPATTPLATRITEVTLAGVPRVARAEDVRIHRTDPNNTMAIEAEVMSSTIITTTVGDELGTTAAIVTDNSEAAASATACDGGGRNDGDRATTNDARMATAAMSTTAIDTDRKEFGAGNGSHRVCLQRLPTGEQAGTVVTTGAHKRTSGWVLHTYVQPSQLEGAGLGLFMREKAKKNDRLARYYGELIGPEEADRRKAAGAQYIVRANSKQYIDAQGYPQQRGCYANDGGPRNNARIATTVNKCATTGECWVSVLARKGIKPDGEVYVPYGVGYNRPWRRAASPAMAMRPSMQDMPDTSMPVMGAGKFLATAMTSLTRAPRRLQRNIAATWNSAVHWASKGCCRRHGRACARFGEALIRALAWSQEMPTTPDPGPVGVAKTDKAMVEITATTTRASGASGTTPTMSTTSGTATTTKTSNADDTMPNTFTTDDTTVTVKASDAKGTTPSIIATSEMAMTTMADDASDTMPTTVAASGVTTTTMTSDTTPNTAIMTATTAIKTSSTTTTTSANGESTASAATTPKVNTVPRVWWADDSGEALTQQVHDGRLHYGGGRGRASRRPRRRRVRTQPPRVHHPRGMPRAGRLLRRRLPRR